MALFTVALPVTGGFRLRRWPRPMAAEMRRTVVAVQARANSALERSVNVVAEQIGSRTRGGRKDFRA